MTIHHFAPFTKKGDQGAIPKSFEKEPDTEDNNEALSFFTTKAEMGTALVNHIIYMLFNARFESINEKASFCRLIPKNRCLVAVEGFYEWKKDGQKKQPYYIHFKDGRPLVFAALYDAWENSEGEILYTFTILTTSSSSALQWLHVC
uniref:Embryonic stem cell-specific 5-hydroxymethylcytosine-binding protein n=1 Tax=Quercus lobata TaxID=97700 RepID=A0A7N2MLC0_QUELO